MVTKYQARRLAATDLHIVAYAQHMATTARSQAARQLFESFVEQERRRLTASIARPAGTAEITHSYSGA